MYLPLSFSALVDVSRCIAVPETREINKNSLSLQSAERNCSVEQLFKIMPYY